MMTPWTACIEQLPKSYNPDAPGGFWTDGEEILCATKNEADTLAAFFETMGFVPMHVNFYEPEEDVRNDAVNDHTGFWSIYPD